MTILKLICLSICSLFCDQAELNAWSATRSSSNLERYVVLDSTFERTFNATADFSRNIGQRFHQGVLASTRGINLSMSGLGGLADDASNFSRGLRQQVRSLREFGVGSKADRRAFLQGDQVAFARSGPLGEIDGFIQRSGNKVSSIVFSAKGRDAAGNLLRIGDAPVRGGTGLQLLSNHRSLSQNLGRAFGVNQVELGGIAVVNDDLLQLLQRLRFEERSVFSPHFGENIPFLGRDFGVQ